MKFQRTNKLFFLIFLSLLLLGYQDCTRIHFLGSSLQASLPVLGISGNGGTYDGKPLIFHHVVDGFQCEGKDRPQAILLRASDNHWYYTENTPQKCRAIDRQEVQGVTLDLSAPNASYQGKTFVPPVKYLVATSENADLGDADLLDGICADSNDVCSLRAALDQASLIDYSSQIEISIPAGIFSISSQIAITNSNRLLISGVDSNSTVIDGGSKTRLFEITAKGSIKFSKIGFTHGSAQSYPDNRGGAIDLPTTGHSLTLESCRFDSNSAADRGGALSAVFGGSTPISISQTRFTNNSISSGGTYGEAIYSGGALSLNESEISGNGVGGNHAVVYLEQGGPFTIENTSIVKNASVGVALSIYQCSVSPCLVLNSTLSDNQGLGVSAFQGLSGSPGLTIQSSTIADNNQSGTGTANLTALMAAGSPLTLENSILSTQIASQTNCSLTGPSTLSADVVSDNSCGSGTGVVIADPRLSQLASNGGFAQTRLPSLTPLSPAIDSGDNAICPSTDQRGLPRPVDKSGAAPRCDIGAVEIQ